MVTAKQLRALRIFRDHGRMMPKVFAGYMWPDSECWKRVAKCGPKGVHRGGGMYIAAGGYIGKLCKQGWVQPVIITHRRFWVNEYELSPAGHEILSAAKFEDRE